MNVRVEKGNINEHMRNVKMLESRRNEAADLSRELGIFVGMTQNGTAFRILGRTATTPDGVRRLANRLRGSAQPLLETAPTLTSHQAD